MEARMLSLFDDEDFLPQEKPKAAKPKKPAAKKENDAEVPAGEVPPPEAVAARDAVPESDTADTLRETQAEITEQSPAIPEAQAETPAAAEPGIPDTTTVAMIPSAEERADTLAEPAAAAPPAADPVPGVKGAVEARAEDEAIDAVTHHLPTETVPEEAPAATPAEPVAAVQHSSEQAEAPEATSRPNLEMPAAAAPGTDEASLSPAMEAAPAATPSPEDDELNRQILGEIMLSDYAAFIHKEYPFDLKSVEVVKKDKEVKPRESARKSPAPVKEEATAPEEEEEDNDEPVAPLPEWDLDKRYYTIGEVSQLFKVNTSHIRFWTNEFKLRPRTTRKGDRLYSPEDIARLRLIHHLVKEKKHTIKGAKEKLKTGKEAVGNKLDLKDSLVSLKDMLIRIKEQL